MNLAELQPSEEIFKNCIIYERKLFIDERGSFTKLFARDFSGINDVVQPTDKIISIKKKTEFFDISAKVTSYE